MRAHLRANLWLLGLTVLLCSVLYPLVLLGLGQTVFRGKAEGGLIGARGEVVTDPARAVGSRLIGQPFGGARYFQPRPSAASWNAAASGASNYAASNPALRERVTAALGPILKYRDRDHDGRYHPVGPDIEAWFRDAEKERAKAGKSPLLAEWARAHPTLAAAWVKDHAAAVALWLNEDAGAVKDKADDVAPRFFESYAESQRGTWPGIAEDKISPVTEGDEIRSAFFEGWWLSLTAEEQARVDPVPADLVMTSGSGLDPHITLAAAIYQSARVAEAWAGEKGLDPDRERGYVEKLLRDRAEAPLGGLAGDPLVNVLEVNLALRNHYEAEATAAR
jgi:K+-transporting ATPase ATPase C chain